MEEYVEYIRSEADELLFAVASGDRQNIKEEFGDPLFNVVVCMLLLAERSDSSQAHEVMEDVVAKMRHRKPFVFDGSPVAVEEAKRLLTEGKAR